MTEQRVDFDGLRMVGRAVEAAPAEDVFMLGWSCGTSACAIGWFCRANSADPLHLIQGNAGLMPVFGKRECFQAVSARFGLTTDDTLSLFSGNTWLGFKSYAHKQEFLARLTQFIADHEPAPVREHKADAAFIRSLDDPIAQRNREDAAGAAMACADHDGLS